MRFFVFTAILTSGFSIPVLAQAPATTGGQQSTLKAVTIEAEHERPFSSANMDIPRTEDDIQPYIILERKDIEASGATNIEDFLRRQLPMNSAFVAGEANVGSFTGAASGINLRGMGTSQTLVLINGRRAPGTGTRGAFDTTDQPDLNGIPLAAIERIEILPTSASAIYGSGALGGVINVVLRRDYEGTEVNIGYENTFDSDAATKRINLTKGLVLEEGRTRILISGQYQENDALEAGERNFRVKARNRQLANNPASIYIPSVSGNPPAGALVNIRSANGSPLFGAGTPNFTHIPEGYRGFALDGIEPLLANAGTYNLDMARDATNSYSYHLGLIPEITSSSVNLSISRDMTDKLQAFVEYGYNQQDSVSFSSYYGTGVGRVSASAPNNPFGQDVLVAYPVRLSDRTDERWYLSDITSQRAVVGFSYELPKNWQVGVDYAWGRNENYYRYQRQYGSPSQASVIQTGVVDVLRDTTSFYTDVDSWAVPHVNEGHADLGDINIRFAGPLANWTAGEIRLVTGIEQRSFKSIGGFEYPTGPGTPAPPAQVRREQSTASYYAELTAPVVSPQMNIPGVYSAELQVAVRHERFDVKSFDTKFDATVPTFGIRYQPVEDITFRASYGEGFVAPTYVQLTPPTLSTSISRVNDPLRGGQEAEIYTWSGGNIELEPEQSESINLGLIFTPRFVPGLRVSVDYYQIEKSNNIVNPSAQQILDNEQLFPSRVIRNPVQPGDSFAVGEITHIYNNRLNLLGMETSGVDLGVSYALSLEKYGSLEINSNTSFADYYREQLVMNGTVIDRVNVPSNSSAPIRARNSTSLTWNYHSVSVGWNAQYYSSYKLNPTSTTVIANQGSSTIPRQIYHDLFVRSSLGNALGGGVLDTLELTFGIKNIFDKSPPTDLGAAHGYSTFGDPRLRRYYVNLKTSF